ncbi:MAG TPA: YdjY domain-containing protein [Planctomycetaceae bacterium]|nr:YdjY domain-containing protein [Planctomycetaceae bacterium]
MLRIAIVLAVIITDSALMAQAKQTSTKLQTTDGRTEPAPQADVDSKSKLLKPLPEALSNELKGATPLNPDGTVLLDVKSKRVVLRTEVACRNCILEMFLVPEGNREHETILRIRSKAFVIHTALLALGLEPGKAASFSPDFVAPTGPEIEMELIWLDEKGTTRRVNACEWMRHNIHRYYAAPLSGPPAGLTFPYKDLRWDKFNNELLWYGPMSDQDRIDLLSKSKKEEYQQAIEKFFKESQSVPMKASFVFVGSSMYKDEDTGEEYYQAEGGHLICVSNFSDALLDIREESTASDGGQTYEAWTEKIPPDGTPVLLVLKQRAAVGAVKSKGTAEIPASAERSKE